MESTMKKIIKILKTSQTIPYAKLAIAVGILICTIVINSCIPLLLKKSIELLGSQNQLFMLYVSVMGYGALWMVGQLMNSIRVYMLTELIEDGSRILMLSLFNHFHSLSLRFHVERQTGVLTHTLNSMSNAIETLMWTFFLLLVPTTCELIFSLSIVAMFYGVLYAVGLAFIFSIFVFIGLWGTRWTTEAQDTYYTQRSKLATFIVESLSHAETVKFFSGQQFEATQCDSLLAAQKKASRDVSKKNIVIQAIQTIVVGLGLTAALILTASQVNSYVLNVSDFVLIQSYVFQFLVPLSSIGYFFFQFQKARTDLKEALNFFDSKPEIIDSEKAIALHHQPVKIVFSSVYFGYNPNSAILEDCSFELAPGKKTALVGASGAGKTSLVRLLFRLYDTNSGSITINGHDIKEITQASLHQLIGYVPQETLLFNNSLLYNVSYGQPDKTKAEIIEALHLACLDYLLETLPEGLESLVGNHGFKISGGEKQRIALARAFLKKPALYIFDEATASLDSKTEQAIMRNIHAITQSATTLVIAHRLTSIIDADTILVIDKGRIIEQGTHKMLLAKKGMYAQLWFTQQTGPTDQIFEAKAVEEKQL